MGGAETYLGRVMPMLAARHHDLAFAYEVDEPSNRTPILLPQGCAELSLTRPGDLDRVAAWQPDVIYTHGLLDPFVEGRLLDAAPGVMFAHAYYGTCISGQKTHRFPVVQPCDRKFGPACLALFYPRRCGGLNPVTMVRDYWHQGARSALLPRYAAVITHSEHLCREFERNGAAGGRVIQTAYLRSDAERAASPARLLASRPAHEPWHLIFVGRMDRLKGGRQLLDAIPRVRAAIGKPLRITFVGDGPARRRWQERADGLTRSDPGVSVEFTGWIQRPQVIATLDSADVLVVPSLWPEPYGLVGPEAFARGLPAVAFATGGIPEWLVDGVNGYFAPGKRPTVEALAEAIVRCLRSLSTSDALRYGALASADHDDDTRHVDALLQILADAASRRAPSTPGAAS